MPNANANPVRLFEQACLVMDPSLRLSCEELLELPYFQEEVGANWGREGERTGRRHEKGSRRRQAGVSKNGNVESSHNPKPAVTASRDAEYVLVGITVLK